MSIKNNKAKDFFNDFFTEKVTPGRVIKANRKNLKITLEEISLLTGIDTGNLSSIENDKKQVGVKTAIKIGLALGLHPSSILFPNGYQIEDPEIMSIKKKSEVFLSKKIAM